MPSPLAGQRPSTEVRAYHLRTTLQLLGDADAAVLARVRGRLDAATLAGLDSASRLAWIPGAHDLALWRAIDVELGQAGLARLARALGLRHVRSGQLSGLLQGVIQLFGMTPAAIVRWIPRGYAEIHRGTGTLRVDEVTDGAARLVLDDLHPALAGEPWLDAVARSFECTLDVCALDGECVVVQPGPEQAVLALHWRPRPRV
jgi:hypothetical protein